MTAANPLRLLAIDHSGVLGGAEHSLLDILEAFQPGADALLLADGPFREVLRRRGITVHLEPLGAAASVRKDGIMPAPAAVFDTIRVARRVARRVAARAGAGTGAYDLFYANSQKAFVVAALAGFFSGRRVAWHLRDILGPPHFSTGNARLATWLANRFARVVITNSRASATAFVAAGGRASLTRVVHNGIDAAPFDAVTPAAAAALRASLGVPSGAPLVVHVGRFHPWKGQQVFLDALARAPRAHGWVVGAPLFGEEAFATGLRARASALGLGARVQFLGLRDDVPALLRAADIVVHSSVYPEPFGRVVVEGMLAGKPVIASNAGGVPEIVADDETGLLTPPGDAAGLADAITRLIENPRHAAAIAAAGSAHARRAFTREAMIRGVRDALAFAAR